MLDLGCGTGQLAIPLAARAASVIAVDPDGEMLAEGRKLADARALRVDWRHGSSFQLAELNLPSLDLVTLGASFHWMDRDALLRELDGLVQPAGGVVVVSGGAPVGGRPPDWQAVVDEVRVRYLGPRRRAGSGTYEHPAERHEEVLRRSLFSKVETRCWQRTLHRSLDQVVGLQFSYSFSSPAQLGRHRHAYEADLRAALTAAFPLGDFVEEVRTEALIAVRS